MSDKKDTLVDIMINSDEFTRLVKERQKGMIEFKKSAKEAKHAPKFMKPSYEQSAQGAEAEARIQGDKYLLDRLKELEQKVVNLSILNRNLQENVIGLEYLARESSPS